MTNEGLRNFLLAEMNDRHLSARQFAELIGVSHTTIFHPLEGLHMGRWVYDDIPPPEGITVYRNTHEAFLQGDIAEAVKAELRRRNTTRGRQRPNNSRRFSGLIICDRCRNTMAFGQQRFGNRVISYRCASKYRDDMPEERKCSRTWQIREDALIAYFNAWFDHMRATGDMHALTAETADDSADRADRLEKEVATLEEKLGRMIHAQAEAASDLRAYYEREIEQLAQALKAAKNRLQDAQRALDDSQRKAAEHGYAKLLEYDNAAFWEQEERVVNQVLHMLCGDTRFLVRDSQIVGWLRAE